MSTQKRYHCPSLPRIRVFSRFSPSLLSNLGESLPMRLLSVDAARLPDQFASVVGWEVQFVTLSHIAFLAFRPPRALTWVRCGRVLDRNITKRYKEELRHRLQALTRAPVPFLSCLGMCRLAMAIEIQALLRQVLLRAESTQQDKALHSEPDVKKATAFIADRCCFIAGCCLIN